MKRLFVILLFFVPLLQAQNPTGTGTANYFAKWSSSTNLTTSALCQSASGGLVGVATCSPTQRLQVNSGNVLVKGLNNFIAKGQTAKYYVGDTSHAVGALYGGGLFLSTHNLPMAMVITDAPSIEASSVGYIGLGTTAPSALVDIEAGNAKCGTDFCVHGTTLFKVADSISVDLLGHIYLGGPGSPHTSANRIDIPRRHTADYRVSSFRSSGNEPNRNYPTASTGCTRAASAGGATGEIKISYESSGVDGMTDVRAVKRQRANRAYSGVIGDCQSPLLAQ